MWKIYIFGMTVLNRFLGKNYCSISFFHFRSFLQSPSGEKRATFCLPLSSNTTQDFFPWEGTPYSRWVFIVIVVVVVVVIVDPFSLNPKAREKDGMDREKNARRENGTRRQTMSFSRRVISHLRPWERHGHPRGWSSYIGSIKSIQQPLGKRPGKSCTKKTSFGKWRLVYNEINEPLVVCPTFRPFP